MKHSLLTVIIILLVCLCLTNGCISGTGFEKQTTICPDSISISYMQEKYKGDVHAWDGFTVSGTWTFK